MILYIDRRKSSWLNVPYLLNFRTSLTETFRKLSWGAVNGIHGWWEAHVDQLHEREEKLSEWVRMIDEPQREKISWGLFINKLLPSCLPFVYTSYLLFFWNHFVAFCERKLLTLSLLFFYNIPQNSNFILCLKTFHNLSSLRVMTFHKISQ